MRKFVFLLIFLFLAHVVLVAQDSILKSNGGYQFTLVKELPHTPIRDQHRSGTCWSYASVSFFESELMRMGKPETDLSEMFIVWKTYAYKAERYVRMHGNTTFSGGGAFHDATWVLKKFGMVPESVYSGLVIGEDKPVHGEMDDVLKSVVDGVLKNANKKLTPVWFDAYKAVLDSYLGKIPASFEYKGTNYTPQSFAIDYLKLNSDDYLEVGSFLHHPFYEKFIIEVPDNWLWGEIYNVPLNEMIEIIDYSLQNGYTVAWGADVSNRGFASKQKGIAVVPDVDFSEMSDSEISRWENLDKSEQDNELYRMDKPGKEKVITQEYRQIEFDNHSTTDDHGMHIIGLAKDQNGTEYYKVKNSWGQYNDYEGYFYVSKPYVALHTIDVMVHKNAIPKNIRTKLGLK
jgi:bleomycin hydrolase